MASPHGEVEQGQTEEERQEQVALEWVQGGGGGKKRYVGRLALPFGWRRSTTNANVRRALHFFPRRPRMRHTPLLLLVLSTSPIDSLSQSSSGFT